jgi:hypothetical protein
MKLSDVLSVKRRIFINRFLSLGVIITAILSIVFALITFYGQNAGNFVMSIDAAAKLRGIVMSETEDFEIKTTRLLSDPVIDARDVTYAWLKIDEVKKATGNFYDRDHDYVAYTFYLKNDGLETVDLVYYLRITSVYNNLDRAIRVLIIEDDQETMYMRPDEISHTDYPDDYPRSTHFLTDRMVARVNITNFRPNQVKKFSVIIWIEIYDPDTTDEILGGMIRMEMVFSVFGTSD